MRKRDLSQQTEIIKTDPVSTSSLPLKLKKCNSSNGTFQARLIRNATVLIIMGNKAILVDPMLGEANSMPPMPMSDNTNSNPLVNMPLSDEETKELVYGVDAVVITHTHPDHWDSYAQNIVPKDKLIFCQPDDKKLLLEQGFTSVNCIIDKFEWDSITIHRTYGQHGIGEIGKMMAPVSGFLFEMDGESLYIAGDTIWCDEVSHTLNKFKPKYTIVNAGEASFTQGGHITMNIDDVIMTARNTEGLLIAVNMEAINHCHLKRSELRNAISINRLSKRVFVPNDGEWFL